MKREFTRLPNLEHITAFPELIELIAEHDKVWRAFLGTKQEYESLTLQRQRAHNQDGKARVEAYRAGKPDPGSKAEAKVVEKMEALQDRTSLLERAYAEVERDIGNVLGRRHGEWLAEVDRLVREDDSEIAEALKTLRGALDKRQAHAGLREWISDPQPVCQKKLYGSGGISEDTAYGVLLGSVSEDRGDEDAGAA